MRRSAVANGPRYVEHLFTYEGEVIQFDDVRPAFTQIDEVHLLALQPLRQAATVGSGNHGAAPTNSARISGPSAETQQQRTPTWAQD